MAVFAMAPTNTVTATTSSESRPASLSSGGIAGIVIGTLVGVVLLIALGLYLLKHRGQHKFTRVANFTRPNAITRHSQRPSTSSDPFISPSSWPPLEQFPPPSTPPRLHLALAGTRDSQDSFFDLDEIDRVIVSGAVSPSSTPDPASSQPGLESTLPPTWQTSGDGTTTPKSQKTLFLNRILKSRAQASDGASFTYRPSLVFSQRRSVSLDSSEVHVDDERLLAEAERTALQDAEVAEKEAVVQGEDEWEEESTASNYSQPSEQLNHPGSISRQHSSSLVSLRNPSRRQSRASALSTGLPPVAEVPDIPRVLQTISRSASVAASSSLDVQMSHGPPSRPLSSVVDPSGVDFPLLTSVNFGKGSSTSGTPPGSILLSTGWGSGSSNRTSRYPSLTVSTLGQSSHSGPDWHHPPPGLAGLNALQAGPLVNPHSPVEERPEQEEEPAVPPPTKRAHLRESRASSIPEVKRLGVVQCEMAAIDVAL